MVAFEFEHSNEDASESTATTNTCFDCKKTEKFCTLY